MTVGIIGMGWVGSSVAISLLHTGLVAELLVHDRNERLAEGEAMDLSHGASFYPPARVRAAALEELLAADAIVIAAGRGSTSGESRLALLQDNAAIVRSIAGRLAGYRGIIVVLTNPVDVMTWVALRASGLAAARVIGTGTMLDTARLRQVLGRELDVDPRSVHAHVIGEHGDSAVPLWSAARVGGVVLREWPGWSAEREAALALEVCRAAYEIIARKGATNHAIGLVTAALLRWTLRGDRRALTVARVQEGAAGIRDVALSLPAIMERGGAVRVLEPELSREERAALERSAELLRGACAQVA